MELEYLNMAYNLLPKVPDLGLHSQAKLVTLILRYNQLDSINGEIIVGLAAAQGYSGNCFVLGLRREIWFGGGCRFASPLI